jgi:hypothetical protein
MIKIQIRPRFRLIVPYSPSDVLERLRTEIEKPDAKCAGTILTGYAIFRIHDDQQHYWSPRLTIEVSEHEHGTLVRGLFAPRPAVWTMLASFYALTIFVGLVGLIFGLSQWSLGMSPYGLWVVPLSILLLVITYTIALTGQNLGLAQMHLLRSVLDKALGSN